MFNCYCKKWSELIGSIDLCCFSIQTRKPNPRLYLDVLYVKCLIMVFSWQSIVYVALHNVDEEHPKKKKKKHKHHKEHKSLRKEHTLDRMDSDLYNNVQLIAVIDGILDRWDLTSNMSNSNNHDIFEAKISYGMENSLEKHWH